MSFLDKFPLVPQPLLSFDARMLQDRADQRTTTASTIWFPLILMGGALILRVLVQQGIVTGLPNLSPLVAFAFAGAVMFPRPLPWWSWALILLVIDWACDGFSFAAVTQGGRYEILLSYAFYVFAAWWGSRLRGRAGVVETLGGTLACSVLFYVVTNTLCWWIEPYYAKNAAGWVQALTTGVPGPYPTTLQFFQHSLIADLTGALLLVIVYNTEAVMRHLRALPLIGTRSTAAV